MNRPTMNRPIGGQYLGTPTGSMAKLLASTIMHSDLGPGGGAPAGGAAAGAGGAGAGDAGAGSAAAGGAGAGGAGAGGAGAGSAGAGADDLGLDQDTYPKAVVEAMMRDRLAQQRRNLPSADEIKAGKEAKEKLDRIEREGMDELTRAQADVTRLTEENNALKGQLGQRTAQDQLTSFAGGDTIGALNPATVAMLLLQNPAVTIDDAGQVQGAETAVALLKQTDPYLFKPSDGKDDAGGGKPRDFGQGRRGTPPGGKTGGSVAAGADLFADRKGGGKKTT